MALVMIGGNVICEMDAVAQAEYEKVARWLNETIAERDALRAQADLLKTSVDILQGTVAALEAQRDFLNTEVARLTICDCGNSLSLGKCYHCDNDT